jgi:hypothetical protein
MYACVVYNITAFARVSLEEDMAIFVKDRHGLPSDLVTASAVPGSETWISKASRLAYAMLCDRYVCGVYGMRVLGGPLLNVAVVLPYLAGPWLDKMVW